MSATILFGQTIFVHKLKSILTSRCAFYLVYYSIIFTFRADSQQSTQNYMSSQKYIICKNLHKGLVMVIVSLIPTCKKIVILERQLAPISYQSIHINWQPSYLKILFLLNTKNTFLLIHAGLQLYYSNSICSVACFL